MSFSESSEVILNDFPSAGNTFKSGSTKDENSKLKVFNPAKPESTIKSAAAAITVPEAAMMVMMFIELLLLLENR